MTLTREGLEEAHPVDKVFADLRPAAIRLYDRISDGKYDLDKRPRTLEASTEVLVACVAFRAALLGSDEAR